MIARARGSPATLRPRRSRGPGAAAAPAPAGTPADLHGRRQQHDRQPAPAVSSPPWPAPTTPPCTSTTGTASGWSANAAARSQPLRAARQRRRPPPRRGLRQPRAHRGFSKAYSSLLAFIACPAPIKRLLKMTAPRTCTRGRPRWPHWPARCSGSRSTSRGDELRAMLYGKTRRVLDHLEKLGAATLNTSRSRSSRCRWPRPTSSTGPGACCRAGDLRHPGLLPGGARATRSGSGSSSPPPTPATRSPSC